MEAEAQQHRRIAIGRIVLDTGARALYVDQKPVLERPLQPGECRMLELLMLDPKAERTRDELLVHANLKMGSFFATMGSLRTKVAGVVRIANRRQYNGKYSEPLPVGGLFSIVPNHLKV